ncbi:Rhs element Vgr protein [Calothrix parasitica NIES-267]|uniref:Rhs element Vgr protein n=1 Tax=Calothrix parasitica NIES-267 TaxID=1973488 RepID=A0A1Z4LK06_9CYAN|nr:Rhs element Vgr protein [Calothrix parasitica NIES-267]
MVQALYRSLPKIFIDGEPAPSNFLDDIIQISVEESLHRPGMFILVVNNDYHPGSDKDNLWRYQQLLQIGKSIKIGFTHSLNRDEDKKNNKKKEKDKDNQDIIIQGEITAIETSFTEKSQAPIIVRGYDISHRLYRGSYNRSFQNMTDSDIVKKIAQEVKIPVGNIKDTSIPHDYIFQSNQNNMEFLKDRATRQGFELFIQDGKIYFRKPESKQGLKLKWLEQIHSFRVRVTSAEQVKEVEVRGWDYSNKRPIVATKKQPELITTTKNGIGSETNDKFNQLPTPKMIVVDKPVFNPKEADLIAQALCDELGGQFVYADAKAEGNIEIRAGRMVELEEMGQHDGTYYITETRHLYQERVYTTEFSVRGLRGGDLLSILSPQTHLKPGQTSLVGIVTDNEDPEGMGRVKVKFPTLTEDHASQWARVVSMGAGNNRGFDCLPEINDEVLVLFEHGDIHRPYVIGGVWNGKDSPPEAVDKSVQDGKVRLRTIKTRVGHQLQFVEEDKGSSNTGFYIHTNGGHQISINDSKKNIEIKTTGGHNLILNDENKTIELSSTGNLKIQAQGNIDISATGVITVQGSLIKLN